MQGPILEKVAHQKFIISNSGWGLLWLAVLEFIFSLFFYIQCSRHYKRSYSLFQFVISSLSTSFTTNGHKNQNYLPCSPRTASFYHHSLALTLLHSRIFPSPALCALCVAIYSKLLVPYSCLLYLLYWV